MIYDEAAAPRDALGRIVQKTEVRGSMTSVYQYAYDDLGRLTDVLQDSVLVEQFTYDDNGNRLTGYRQGEGTRAGVYDDQDRLISYGDWTYTYTANGELATKLDTVTGEQWDYTYDVFGNLLSVVLPDGRFIEYVTDGRHRRVGKKIDGVMVRQWLYEDQLNPVVELDGSGNVLFQYVYASREQSPDFIVNAAGDVYRVISDHLGSPRLVVNVANEADVLLEAEYSAFGERTVIAGDPAALSLGFAGGVYDVSTGLVRFGARDYDPVVARWTRKDPLRFEAGRNFYAYAFNDPVNLFDPTGREPTGAGGASGNGEGGGEGAGNDPIQSIDAGSPENSSRDACFDSCMESQGADIAGHVILMCVPFLPTPKTPWEMGRTLGGGSEWTTWLSRASSAIGLPANNPLRTTGRYAARASMGVAVGASTYYGTSAALCGAQCSQ